MIAKLICVLFARFDPSYQFKKQNTEKILEKWEKILEKSGNFVSLEKWEPCFHNTHFGIGDYLLQDIAIVRKNVISYEVNKTCFEKLIF